MKLRNLLLAALIFFNCVEAIAQQSRAVTSSLGGTVSSFASITLSGMDAKAEASSSEVSARSLALSHDKVIVHLTGSPLSANSRVTVRVLMRSNCRYELRVARVGSSLSPAINIYALDAKPTGTQVTNLAMASIVHLTSPSELSSEPLIVAKGSRISTGGPASRSNAIEIEMALEAGKSDGDRWTADLMLTMVPVQ